MLNRREGLELAQLLKTVGRFGEMLGVGRLVGVQGNVVRETRGGCSLGIVP